MYLENAILGKASWGLTISVAHRFMAGKKLDDVWTSDSGQPKPCPLRTL